MKSFGLLRTSPILSSNVKLVVSNDMIYLESFNSSPTLGDERYKKHLIGNDSTYNEELSKFWKDTPNEIIFKTLDLSDQDIMHTSYDNQINDIYNSGASNLNDSDYDQEFEYVSPIHLSKNDLPKDFIIFRVDNPGTVDLNSSNFRSEILDNMKVVERFDLSPTSKLGKFMTDSFNKSDFPNNSIDLNFNKSEFTYWNGVDYKTGEYIRKGRLMESEFNREMTFSQGNEILTNGFKDNDIIYPFLLNMKFLFDDTPATPDRIRKWDINRYYGYYGKMEKIMSITPYKPPTLKIGMKINEDKIFTLNGESIDPFERGYKDSKTYYIEYKSEFYIISKVSDNKFKIISDVDLPSDIDSNYNKETIYFDLNNEIKYLSEESFNIYSDSDVLIIKIDDKYHRIIKENNKWKILSDYEFKVSNNIFRYYINRSDPNYTKVINLNDSNDDEKPITFEIYQYNFCDVKDFDVDIIDTGFSKFEFEFSDEITNTEEPKMYEKDISIYNNDILEKYLFKNKVVSIPVGSEYLSTYELYEVMEKGNYINKMWSKLPSVFKWGAQGSISNGDYPYLFNLNRNADYFNRTTDISEQIPVRSNRNMDYFYTLSDSTYNFEFNKKVDYQSLSIPFNEKFNIKKYFNIEYNGDYFNEIFNSEMTLYNEVYPIKKFSQFLVGDNILPSKTLFRGIELSIYEIDSIITDVSNGNKSISSINVTGTNEFIDYDFSIILSDIENDIENDFIESSNISKWIPIEDWSISKEFKSGDIVLFNSTSYKDENGQYGFNGYGTESNIGTVNFTEYVYPDGTTEELVIDNSTNFIETVESKGPNNGISQIFKCTSNTIITDPNFTIDNDPNWDTHPNIRRSIFYNPNFTYEQWDYTTHDENYLSEKDGIDFNYLKHVIFYKGEYYICTKSQIEEENKTPDYIGVSVINGLRVVYWEKVNEYLNTTNYSKNTIVTMNGSLYLYNLSNQDLKLVHTFDIIENELYDIDKVVRFNDIYYYSDNNLSSFDNGINIYINKKYKNILINIYFNDNLSEVYNIKRDDLYKKELQQIVASNFIETINNINIKNGFSNNLKYYIIEEDGSFIKYDIENIEEIPFICQINSPEEVKILSNSLKTIPFDINESILNINKFLDNNEISDISEIDYYNKSHISYINKRYEDFNINSKTEILYRYNSMYSPIFKDINLFDKTQLGNYKFKESYGKFGEMVNVIKSKVGDTNLLKISDDNYKSLFPQVDEFGYFIDNHNIFKSTWDKKYYKKSINNK